MIVMKLTPVHKPGRWLYLKAFDVEAYNGRGSVKLTDNPEKALMFADHQSAFEAWRKQSSKRPLRPDGKPNRPLTAYHAAFERLGDDNEDWLPSTG